MHTEVPGIWRENGKSRKREIHNTLRETFDTAIRSGASELDPKSLIIAGVVLLYFGYRKISSMT